jgi:translation initiation factor 1
MQHRKSSRPVYSTEHGRLCSGCGKAPAHCSCASDAVPASGDGVIRLRRESKGRGGKTVTVIDGLPGDTAALKAMAKKLKQHCGVGGAVKERQVEIQGDHRERIATLLRMEGYTVKLAGG